MKSISALILGLCIIVIPAFASTADKKKSVFIKEARSTEVFDLFTFPAKVVPEVNSLILSESQGIISGLPVTLGQEVKKNQILVKVEHTDPVFKYQPVFLRSPIDGVVSKVFFSQGSQITKGEKIIMVTDPKQVKILIEIPSKDLGSLKQGMKGSLTLKNQKEPAEVEIVGISPFVDPATGTAAAQLKSKTQLIPGSLGKASFKSNIHDGFVMPQAVLTYIGKSPHVRLIENQKTVKKIEVELGPKRRGMIEILSGLKKGDLVVERSSGFIKDGDEVEVKNLPELPAMKKKEIEKDAKSDGDKDTGKVEAKKESA